MPEPQNTIACTHCGAARTPEEVAALPLAAKHGGRVRYENETHEYRICACGHHILVVIRHMPSVQATRPRHDTPPLMVATNAQPKRR